MRLIVDCDPEHVSTAVKLLSAELAEFDKYDRVGWGWAYPLGNARCFVRRIKDGLSLKQLRAPGSDVRAA